MHTSRALLFPLLALLIGCGATLPPPPPAPAPLARDEAAPAPWRRWQAARGAGWIAHREPFDLLASRPTLMGTDGVYRVAADAPVGAWDLRHPAHAQHTLRDVPDGVAVSLDGAAMCRLAAAGLRPVSAVVLAGEWRDEHIACLDPTWVRGALDVRPIVDADVLERLLARSPHATTLAIAGAQTRHLYRVAGMRALETLMLEDRAPQVAYHGNPDPPPATHLSDAAFGRLGLLRTLRSLRLEGVRVDAPRLAVIAELDRLEHLSVRGGMRAELDVRGLARLTELRVLDLWAVSVGDAELAAFAGLRHLEAIQPLGEVSELGLERLGAFHRLRGLNLAGAQITDEGLAHLGGLHALRTLSIRNAPITSSGLAALRDNPHLVELRLEGTRVDDGIAPLLAGWPDLQRLDLSQTHVADAALVGARGLVALVALDLEHTGVGDEGLAHLSGLRSLRDLELAHTRVRGPGLEALLPLSGTLTRLTLEETGVTSDAIPTLVQLTALSWLNLSETCVGDEGASQLGQLSQLEWLFLAGTDVTPEAAMRLRASLESAHVYL